jgi:hypothetical protein
MDHSPIPEASMILIKYASRQRRNAFKDAMFNIWDTIQTKDYLILVSADEDDLEMNCDRIKKLCAHPNVKLIFGRSSSKVEAINRDMEHAGEWDILVNMSDDMFFTFKGWDEVIRSKAKRHFPDGDFFLHFDDGYVHDALATMSIIDKKYYDRDGYIYHPSYRSFSCDAEAWFVARMRGRHMYFPEILATHQHPTNVRMGNDDLYKRNSLHTAHDTEVYWSRLHSDFGMKDEGYTGPFLWDQYKKI